MKRIKFTELGFKKNFDTLIVIVGIICLSIGLVGVFAYSENKFIPLAGLSVVFTTYPQLKNFFYSNYFVWNKTGGNIKINAKSKNIVFSEIESFQQDENKLTIIKKNKNYLDFSLNNVNLDDINSLNDILSKYIKKS